MTDVRSTHALVRGNRRTELAEFLRKATNFSLVFMAQTLSREFETDSYIHYKGKSMPGQPHFAGIKKMLRTFFCI